MRGQEGQGWWAHTGRQGVAGAGRGSRMTQSRQATTHVQVAATCSQRRCAELRSGHCWRAEVAALQPRGSTGSQRPQHNQPLLPGREQRQLLHADDSTVSSAAGSLRGACWPRHHVACWLPPALPWAPAVVLLRLVALGSAQHVGRGGPAVLLSCAVRFRPTPLVLCSTVHTPPHSTTPPPLLLLLSLILHTGVL